ncbi:MAG TPA: YidC/Oxa1 family membrane protein insertase [Acidimicrobiales bacterium]|nr:YidC/Oxa1 family membrane protein insertase [Acidimicrobiales bacterium]
MFQALAGLLAFFYELVPSYAAAIALLTLSVMLVLTPLTWKSTRSMLEMQRLQPEIKKLQAKHKGDRQKLNEEMMAFYKEHKVNPVAGCLPMLLQMPVFFVMYQVIQGLSRTSNGVPKPKYIGEDTKLYQDLVADGGKMMDFGIDLARRAADAHPSFGKALPYFVLIALVVITQYIQTKQMQGRSGAPPNPQMVMMQRVMPIFFGFISFTIAAGVNIYFLISSLFRITQQTLMYQFDPVLKSHVAQQVREVEAKAFEKPRNEPKALANGKPGTKSAKNTKGGGQAKSGNGNRKGGNRAKKGR